MIISLEISFPHVIDIPKARIYMDDESDYDSDIMRGRV